MDGGGGGISAGLVVWTGAAQFFLFMISGTRDIGIHWQGVWRC
jgi:hypothetical protein